MEEPQTIKQKSSKKQVCVRDRIRSSVKPPHLETKFL